MFFARDTETDCHVHKDFIRPHLVPGGLSGRDGGLPADKPEEKIMIRLLIAAALGYAASRIVQETVASVPDEFEPMPEPPREPQRGAVDRPAVEPAYSTRR